MRRGASRSSGPAAWVGPPPAGQEGRGEQLRRTPVDFTAAITARLEAAVAYAYTHVHEEKGLD